MLSASRECGECNLCCILPQITPLAKPKNTPCRHLKDGCLIYPERPECCSRFYCGWRFGFGTEAERPDKVGYYTVGEELGLGAMSVMTRENLANWPPDMQRRIDAMVEGGGRVYVFGPDSAQRIGAY